jgi:hypothetical protein
MDVKSNLKVGGVHKYLSIFISILGNFRARHEISGPNQDWGSSIWKFEFHVLKSRNSNLYVCDLQRQSIKMPAK